MGKEIDEKTDEEIRNIRGELFDTLNNGMMELEELSLSFKNIAETSYESVFSFCSSMFSHYINDVKICEKEEMLKGLSEYIDFLKEEEQRENK